MFDHSLKNGDDYLARNFFYKYYMALVERLVGNKPKVDGIKDVTTRNLLDNLYHQNYYKLIDIDLSRLTNTTIRH